MSDMPERIWASGGHVIEWDTTIGTFSALRDPNRTEYRRADAPPTVAEAMQCPEVRALVDCLAGFLTYAEGTPITRQEADDMVTNSRAALRPFIEGQERE